MKKNLSKNAVKSMAIGLAIAMGSSVAISGISGNLVETTAALSNFNNIQNPDFSSPMAQNHFIITENGLLFKVKSVGGDENSKTGEAIFIGKANIDAISSPSTTANGTQVPYKAAEFSEGVLTVNSQDSSKTHRISVTEIGDGANPLQQYTIQSGSAPQGAALSTLTKDEVNAVLAKAITVKTKAFDNISITDTSESDKLILPATLTTLEAKAFGGVAQANTDNPLYIDAKAISTFNNFNAEAFDKDTAAQKRTVNVELANHTSKKAFDQQITGKDNVTSIEKEAPTITSVEYAGETEVILNASEDLKTGDPLGDFTITKKDEGSRAAITVNNAKVESGSKTKIKLTLDSSIDENGTYLVNYQQSSEENKKVKDANENLLDTIDSGLEFTVDRIAPVVTSVEVSNAEKNKVVITFDKVIKQKNSGELKNMFTVNKTTPNVEKITINSAQITGANKKVELTLAKEVVYGDVLTVSYTSDNVNNLQNQLGVDVTNFANKEVTNNVEFVLNENDIINAGGYKFKVLSGSQTATLTGKSVIRNEHNNASILNGVISISGSNVNVTQIGDGINALEGDNFNVEELNNIIPNVTTIKTKAFDGKTLEGATRISFPKVTVVEANGLGIKSGCKTVELPAVGLAQASSVEATAFAATGGTNSVTKVKVQEDAQETLQNKFAGVTVSKVVDEPEVGQTIDMGNFQFTILTKDDDETDETVGTVKLTKVESGNALGSNSGLKNVKLQNGVLRGQKDQETFIYNFTEIDIQSGKEYLDATKFETLDISKVTKIAGSSFENATLPEEVTFPAVVELGENSFKGVNGLTTLTLPGLVSEVSNISDQAFGNNGEQTSVTTLKLHENTAYVLLDHFANKNVKVRPILDATGKTEDGIVVSGKRNEALSKDIVITIENQIFKSNLTDVSKWFTNLPEGLKAKVKENNLSSTSSVKQITVTISGTPRKVSSEKISIVIPSQDLIFEESIIITTDAKFDITEKSSSGGGSSSSSSSQSGSISLNNGNTQQTTISEENSTENTSEGTTSLENNEIDVEVETKELKIDTIQLPKITASVADFSDVPATHWASESIGKLSSAGIIKGVPGGGFNANGNSKRADVAIMLTRLLGLENETSTARFSDVAPNAYYANAVGVAREYGIINGNADGTFNPESYISRQDTMVMISRILDNLNVSTNADTTVLAQFSDTANISQYALEATSKLVNLGIINGNEGKINPKHAITRAEMAVIMDRVYDIIDKTVKEEAAKETTTEATSETTSSSESTTGTESTSATESTTETTTQKK